MLETKNDSFCLNGEKLVIYSGAMHYFRIPSEYWEDRLLKLKQAGFNTVETYVCWNLHEKNKGEFDFTGMLDIAKFVKTAQKVGLYAIVRPGPYICAEWEFGGFPAWLLKDKNMRLRCMYPDYLNHVSDFFHALFEQLVDLQESRGGNIIAFQIENEYGSYGNDMEYKKYIKQLILDCDAVECLFTSDGPEALMIAGGTLPDVYKVLNFGSGAGRAFNSLKGIQDNAPKMCGEFWCGWFDHWGEIHHIRPAMTVTNEINKFIEMDASFNMYMFHGGTNFGFMAGANCDRKYSPTVTSYDYNAPLNEWGGYSTLYHQVRKLLCEKQGIEMTKLIPEPKLQSIGEVKLTQSASILDNIKELGTTHHSAAPESMEFYGQNYGMILYHVELPEVYGNKSMSLEEMHDRAYVFVNGELLTIMDRNDKDKRTLFGNKTKRTKNTVKLPAFDGTASIDILVDAMGRVNYGPNIHDRKGLQGVRFNYQYIFGWDVVCLPLESLEKVKFTGGEKYPKFMKGTFTAKTKDDCFVHMDGFKKGSVFVNGINIGRYWSKGPQKALYIPGVWLKEENEIIVLELEECKKATVVINDKPALG